MQKCVTIKYFWFAAAILEIHCTQLGQSQSRESMFATPETVQ